MGVRISLARKTRRRQQCIERIIQGPNRAQKQLIKLSWPVLKAQSDTVGIAAFTRVFQENPYILSAFGFAQIMELDGIMGRRRLHAHSKRIFKTVETSVECLDRSAALQEHFMTVAEIHKHSNVQPSYIHKLTEPFTVAAGQVLEQNGLWNSEFEDAWRTFVNYINSSIEFYMVN